MLKEAEIYRKHLKKANLPFKIVIVKKFGYLDVLKPLIL